MDDMRFVDCRLLPHCYFDVGSVMEMTDAENAAVTKNFRPKKSNGKQKPGMG